MIGLQRHILFRGRISLLSHYQRSILAHHGILCSPEPFLTRHIRHVLSPSSHSLGPLKTPLPIVPSLLLLLPPLPPPCLLPTVNSMTSSGRSTHSKPVKPTSALFSAELVQ